MSKVLTDVVIKGLKRAGRHHDGGQKGLYLVLTPRKAGGFSRSWVVKYMFRLKSYEMGLGPYPEVSLARAREKARDARRLIKDERQNPLEVRRTAEAAEAAKEAKLVTFEEAAKAYIASHKAGWKNAKHASQWENTLATYAHPIIGKLSVADIDTGHISKILEPHWTSKTETMSRVRMRLEAVLGWATTRGYRSGDNPARWKGHLATQFPKKSKVAAVRPQPSMPYAELPAFMAKLRAMSYASAHALEFLTLTATRTNEVIGAKWDEINLGEKLWRIPAGRMKAGKAHEVPLSDRALELLASLPRMKDNPYVFFGGRKGAPLSNMAMLQLMKEHAPGFVPHGMRASFRTWAGEMTNHPREVAEHALAHRIPDAVEAAYARSTLLPKRRRLMAEWAKFCGSPPRPAGESGKVVAIGSRS
nr:site-specific integrase [Nitrosomonas nitrosa]